MLFWLFFPQRGGGLKGVGEMGFPGWGVLDYLGTGISHYPPMAEVFVFPILFGFRISRWDDHLFLYVFFLSFTPCFFMSG